MEGLSVVREVEIRTAATVKRLPCFPWATLLVRAGLLIGGLFWRDTAWLIFWCGSWETPFALVALIGRQQMSFLISLEQYGIAWQLGQALYTSAFYVWETFVLYQIPPMLEEPSIISGVLPSAT